MDGIVPGSPSSLGSDNSDNDAVNTSSAKVYFGQFQTPEKKLAALVDSAPLLNPSVLNEHAPGPSLLRRSTRLSSSPMQKDAETEMMEQSEQEDEEDEDTLAENRRGELRGGSWQDAPFPEFLRKDEPSSAIASRIMRAHDNPSPPPKALRPSLTPRSSSKLASDLVFPPIPSSAESSDAVVELLLQTTNEYEDTPTPPPFDLFDMSPLPAPTIQRQLSHSPTPRRPSNNSSSSRAPQADAEADLISFDRSVLLSSTSDSVEIHSPTPRHAQQQTVDDLLFSSPLQPTSPKDGPQVVIQGENQISVAGDALLLELESPAHSYPEGWAHLQMSVSEMECSEVIHPRDELDIASQSSDIVHSETNQNERQTTPIAHLPVSGPNFVPRRSPRLSTLLLPTPQVAPRLSTPGRTPKAKSPNPDGSQTRKRHRDGSEKVSRMSLTPKKHEWAIESDASGSEPDLSQSPSKKGRRDRKRVKKCSVAPSDAGDTRLAGSLSPGSALILTTLVSSDQLASTSQVDVDMVVPATPQPEPMVLTEDKNMESSIEPSTPPPLSSVLRPPPGIFASHTLTPARGSFATRSLLALNSPVKLTLTPAPSDDPNRTPARRIPIKQINDISRVQHSSLGQSSGMRMPSSVTYTPVFSRPPPSADDPDRSPAKRVPVSEFVPKESSSHLRNTSTSRSLASTARPRSGSVEHQGVESNVNDSKPILKAGLANGSNAKCALPGPSKRVFLTPTKGPITSSDTKPALKVESRIPRPGTTTKPTATTRNSKLPMPSARKLNGSTSLSSRLPSPSKAPITKVTRLHNSSSSGSDDSGSGQLRASGSGSSRNTPNGSIVKRRRETEKPTPARPMVKMRQVVPGMYGGPVKAVALNGSQKNPEQLPAPSPIKPVAHPRPIKAREVVKGTLQDFELTTSSFKSLEALSEARAKERAELEKANEKAQKESSPPAPTLEAFTFKCHVPEQQEEQMDIDYGTTTVTASDSLHPSEEMIEVARASQPEEMSSNGWGARRSSRARRSVSTDVFGTVSTMGLPAQSSSRHRSGTGPPKPKASSAPPNLVFHTNGLALKTLTNNNTTRNQHYHAQLETHIIRKAGDRPESPTMKLRTILEKQKEEQGKMRAERARRRRGPDASDESGDIEMDESIEMQPSKHRRGPGDEEDYETPVRPNNGRKAVKWDRGLEVSVFLDEIEVQPGRHRVTETTFVPRKGCLSVMPNRAPLDSLGNPLNADSPLSLVTEKVVVTKYVYDNDEEAQVFDPPPPKTTRSKSKKK